MPRKNSIKTYVKNGYYHIYNRGVEKRRIFMDQKDYTVFLHFLKEYLLPPDHPDLVYLRGVTPHRKPVNCNKDISLLAYALMPNHFHLFVKQLSNDGLKSFMIALSTNYSMYFNKRYERVGHLFQGVYKAAMIMSEPYYLHITRYIHRNPFEIVGSLNQLASYNYSSYRYYLDQKPPDWLHPEEILKVFEKPKNSIFHNHTTYKDFVESFKETDDHLTEEILLEPFEG